MHLRDFSEARHAARHAVEDAARRVGQGLGAALLGFHQALAAGGERFIDRLALRGNVGQEFLLLGKAALYVLQLRE